MTLQLARRNINLITRKYLTGRRYKEEKKSFGENQYGTNSLNRVASNLPPTSGSLKGTAQKIGAQVGMSHQGVKDAESLLKLLIHFRKLHSNIFSPKSHFGTLGKHEDISFRAVTDGD